MVKVYFESKTHAELIAVFDCEDTYLICLKALEKEAKRHRMTVTESVQEENDINKLSIEIKKSEQAKKVLQLMDKDFNYSEALEMVLKENPETDKKQLETELNNYI